MDNTRPPSDAKGKTKTLQILMFSQVFVTQLDIWYTTLFVLPPTNAYPISARAVNTPHAHSSNHPNKLSFYTPVRSLSFARRNILTSLASQTMSQYPSNRPASRGGRMSIPVLINLNHGHNRHVCHSYRLYSSLWRYRYGKRSQGR